MEYRPPGIRAVQPIVRPFVTGNMILCGFMAAPFNCSFCGSAEAKMFPFNAA